MSGLNLSPPRGREGDNRLSVQPQMAEGPRSVSAPTMAMPGSSAPGMNGSSGEGLRVNTNLARPASAMPLGGGGDGADTNHLSSPQTAGPIRASTGAMLSSPLTRNRNHDDFVMDTNNSSIVSKRSVEKLYSAGEPEYFRCFVSKFKRRSPLINRGYWLRMKAVEHAVARFLGEPTSKTKLVINLGCGYDPLPFSFLGRQRELCENTLFVDVDFPLLMRNKVGIISSAEPLNSLIPDLTLTGSDTGLLATSLSYAAVGCDLKDIQTLKAVLQEHFQVESSPVSIMFVAEVSIAYMEAAASQAVLEWAATYDDVRFTLLEQQVPDGLDHPFAMTMMSHFNKLRTPLPSLGTLEQTIQRFAAAGWPDRAIEAHSLWELWSEPAFMSAELRRWLDTIEPFDEWEEFALFASHYFLLVAERKADTDYQFMPARASLSANRMSTMGGSGATTPSTPDPTDTDPANLLMAQELPSSHIPRRFAALAPSPLRAQDGDAIGLHGGLGTQERQVDCDTYSWFDTAQPIDSPPLRNGIMCHTITRLGGTNNCMLVGGRTSPDKALSDCWLRQDGTWQKVASLPEGRYRHCAVSVRLPTEPRPAHTLLIYGGKASDGHVLDEWMLWTGEAGWQNLRVVGDHPCARFGAAMITDKAEGISGIIVGGLTNAGRVLNDFWHWNLQPDMSVTCQNVTQRASSVLKSNIWILGRFGAQLARSNQGILLVGGVAGGRMLTRNEQILNMRTLRTTPVRGARQLYVGCSVQNVDGGILILGGGATCFSFGTFWNKGCMLMTPAERRNEMSWKLLTARPPPGQEPKTLIMPSDALSPGDSASRPTSRGFSSPITPRFSAFPKIVEPGASENLSTPVTQQFPVTDSTSPIGSAVTSNTALNSATSASPRRSSAGMNSSRGGSGYSSPGYSSPKSPPRVQLTDGNSNFSNHTSPERGIRGSTLVDTNNSSFASQSTFASQPAFAPQTTFASQTQTSHLPPPVSVNQQIPSIIQHAITIPRVQLNETNTFLKYLRAGQPVIITGTSFGRCTRYWTDEYLKESVGVDREVVIHSSASSKLDFQTKNFRYETQRFGDFIDSAARGQHVYLRSLSHDKPAKKPTHLSEDFPELSRDFQLPKELAYVIANLHSSPLRVTGDVAMWLHYDVMDNVLCQVRGRKRVVLFPPSDVTMLGFAPGASSSSLDVFNPPPPPPSRPAPISTTSPTMSSSAFPLPPTSFSQTHAPTISSNQAPSATSLAHTHPHEAILSPNEALLIPSCWLHATSPPLDPDTTSVAINCFFRGLNLLSPSADSPEDPRASSTTSSDAYAVGKDVYANRDLAAYERGRREVEKLVKSFQDLPPQIGGFYLERLGAELGEKGRGVSASAGLGLGGPPGGVAELGG